MKKTLFLSALTLTVSLACAVTQVATPQVFPTFDPNSIPTMVVQTARVLALSATVTHTSQPTETPSRTPTSTRTLTATPTTTSTADLTASPTLPATSTSNVTGTVTRTPSAAVTGTRITATNTLPSATKTVTLTKTALPITFTKTVMPTPPAGATNTPTGTVAPPTSVPPTNTETPATCPQMNIPFEAQVIELINIERINAGLSALNDHPQLTLAAQLHSADMACNDYFSHTGRDGSNFSERAKRQGYNIGYGGENIASGYSTPEKVVQGWMDSPGHKANILGENYVDIGVGYAYSKGSSYGAYWTAVFGSQ